MTIAPFFARDPYNAAAVAPFSTVISSISSGFMLEILSPQSGFAPLGLPNCVLSIGRPLIIYKGWLSPEIEVLQRMVTLLDPPGPVSIPVSLSPATFPAKGLATLVFLAL